eukprot:1718631-Amphidinium_carterae.1
MHQDGAKRQQTGKKKQNTIQYANCYRWNLKRNERSDPLQFSHGCRASGTLQLNVQSLAIGKYPSKQQCTITHFSIVIGSSWKSSKCTH